MFPRPGQYPPAPTGGTMPASGAVPVAAPGKVPKKRKINVSAGSPGAAGQASALGKF